VPQFWLNPWEEVGFNPDALVAPLRADVVSGASSVGRAAADVVQRAVLDIPCENAATFREKLVTLSIKILEAQPAMAPLVALTSKVLNSFQEEDLLDEATRRVLEATRSYLDGRDQAVAQVAAQANSLIPEGATILTISFSSMVRAALEGSGNPRSLRAICLESRPSAEGAALAHLLSQAGLRVSYAVDAAMGTLIQEADLILLGADSLGDRGVANKIGSMALVSLARERNIPAYFLLDQSKLLPFGFPQRVEDDRPSGEVLKMAEGIQVWNRYFEIVPVGAITGIVTEDGHASPVEIQEFRSRIQVPSELRAWAKARASDFKKGVFNV